MPAVTFGTKSTTRRDCRRSCRTHGPIGILAPSLRMQMVRARNSERRAIRVWRHLGRLQSEREIRQNRHRAQAVTFADKRATATRSKYNAKPTTVDGIRFASKAEARRYGELKLLERAGEIRNLELQPLYPIIINSAPVKIRSKGYPNGRDVVYIGDFRYFSGNKTIVEDVKGADTPVSRLKRALVEAIYSVRVVIVR